MLISVTLLRHMVFSMPIVKLKFHVNVFLKIVLEAEIHVQNKLL